MGHSARTVDAVSANEVAIGVVVGFSAVSGLESEPLLTDDVVLVHLLPARYPG